MPAPLGNKNAVGRRANGQGGPYGHEKNLKHGLYALMALRKTGKPSGRTKFGRAFKAQEQEYVSAYGGDDVSKMELVLITDVVWHDFFISACDAEISRAGIMMGEKVHPLLEVRARLAGHRRETLKTLGLKRRPKDVTPKLETWLSSMEQPIPIPTKKENTE